MSGYAWCHSLGVKPDLDSVRFGELPHMEMIDWTHSVLADNQPINRLIVESYTITARTLKLTRQPWSLEQIGALRWLAHQYRVPFILQSPAGAKGFATDEKLKAVGWWPSSDHARDAARHLMLNLVAEGEFNLEVFRGNG